jgi:hypothetical protein
MHSLHAYPACGMSEATCRPYRAKPRAASALHAEDREAGVRPTTAASRARRSGVVGVWLACVVDAGGVVVAGGGEQVAVGAEGEVADGGGEGQALAFCAVAGIDHPDPSGLTTTPSAASERQRSVPSVRITRTRLPTVSSATASE